MNDCPKNIDEFLLAAAPKIADKIEDMSLKFPSFYEDLPNYVPFANGQGKSLQKLIVRAEFQDLEDDFSGWKSVNDTSGCSPCEQECSTYNWKTFGGHSIDRQIISFMSRDIESPFYCVKQLQSAQDYDEWADLIAGYMAERLRFEKEFNIVQNAIRQSSVKVVVDQGGFKSVRGNPTLLPALGAQPISMLTFEMLSAIYAEMIRRPNQFKALSGAGTTSKFIISSSPEVFNELFRSDPSYRQDINYSSSANNLLQQYGVFDSIRGMFDIYNNTFAPKYDRDPVTGQLREVKPFKGGYPAEFGTFTDYTDEYLRARYTAVDIYGLSPLDIYIASTESKIGGMSFGPEPTFFDKWIPVYKEKCVDPFQREVKYVTTGEIGIDFAGAKGMIRLIVDTGGYRALARYFIAPGCPPAETPPCSEIPAQGGCPCPLVVSYTRDPISGFYLFEFYVPVTGVVGGPINIELNTGGFITGTLQAISADQRFAHISFPVGTVLPDCDAFTRILTNACSDQLVCKAKVISVRPGTVPGESIVTLDAPIDAITAGNVIQGSNIDGVSENWTVVSVNQVTLEWTVTGVGTSEYTCVCVPPSTNPQCPACGPDVTVAPCP